MTYFCLNTCHYTLLSQTFVYIVKDVSMWNSVILKVLPAFHYSDNITWVTKSIHKKANQYSHV